jgi:hypothetical protein
MVKSVLSGLILAQEDAKKEREGGGGMNNGAVADSAEALQQ